MKKKYPKTFIERQLSYNKNFPAKSGNVMFVLDEGKLDHYADKTYAKTIQAK